MAGETMSATAPGDGSATLQRLCYEDLQKYTDNFSQDNYLGKFQFGKIYRGQVPSQSGTLPKPVTVKIWETRTEYEYYEGDNPQRLIDEVLLLQCESFSHPGLMKLYGYCIDESEQCGVVYDFKPYDTVCNLLHNGSFKWWIRIKVALGLARLVAFLHESDHSGSPLMIRNIDLAHVLVDEDWNPKLYDFSMITGGIFPDRTLYRTQYIQGCHGFEEPFDRWSQKSDVYAFGVVLACLITNDYWTEEDRRAGVVNVLGRMYALYGKEFFMPVEKSWVINSLQEDSLYFASDGFRITELTAYCVSWCPSDRGTMKDVVTFLHKLEVVRRNPDIFPSEVFKRKRSPSSSEEEEEEEEALVFPS